MTTYRVTIKGTIEIQATSMEEAELAVSRYSVGDMLDSDILDITELNKEETEAEQTSK